jgi:hypothetical protein
MRRLRSFNCRSNKYGNDTFVAVGTRFNDSKGLVVTSSDGATWTAQTLQDETFGDLVFGEDVFVALYDGSPGYHNKIVWSTNGTTWTEASISGSGSGSMRDLIYANDKFLAVGGSGVILTSSDGKNWTGQSSGVVTTLNKAWGNDSEMSD